MSIEGVDGCGWGLNGCGRIWVGVDVAGSMSMAMDGHGWGWMRPDGAG